MCIAAPWTVFLSAKGAAQESTNSGVMSCPVCYHQRTEWITESARPHHVSHHMFQDVSGFGEQFCAHIVLDTPRQIKTTWVHFLCVCSVIISYHPTGLINTCTVNWFCVHFYSKLVPVPHYEGLKRLALLSLDRTGYLNEQLRIQQPASSSKSSLSSVHSFHF